MERSDRPWLVCNDNARYDLREGDLVYTYYPPLLGGGTYDCIQIALKTHTMVEILARNEKGQNVLPLYPLSCHTCHT